MDALYTLILRHRDPLRRALVIGGVAVPLLFAAAALLVERWPARRFLLLYVAPFFVAFFAWAWMRLRRMEDEPPAALAAAALAVLLGAVRFAGAPVPYSGHMLFFVYAALTVWSTRFLLLVVVLAAETTWFKLVLWRDPRSWALGIAAVRIFIHRTFPHPTLVP